MKSKLSHQTHRLHRDDDGTASIVVYIDGLYASRWYDEFGKRDIFQIASHAIQQNTQRTADMYRKILSGQSEHL